MVTSVFETLKRLQKLLIFSQFPNVLFFKSMLQPRVEEMLFMQKLMLPCTSNLAQVLKTLFHKAFAILYILSMNR